MTRRSSGPARFVQLRPRRRALAAVVAAASVLLGMAAVADAGNASARTSTFTYTKRTVVVPTATVQAQLLSVSKNGATYTFRSNSGVLAKLKAGKVMLLQGLAVRDVSKTAKVKGHFVVTSTPAKLTDVIANGTLSWNEAVPFTKGFVIGGNAVPPERVAARTVAVPSRFGMAALRAGAITVKGKTNSYSYSVNFDPSGTGVKVTITITKSAGVELQAKITGTLDNLKTAGHLSVNNGKLSSAKLLANNLQGSFTLGYAAKPLTQFGLGQAGGIKIELPAEILVPFFVGPVPLFVAVRVAFFASAGFSGFDQSLSGSWTLKYDGKGGFSTSSSGATSPAGALSGLGKIILNAADAVSKGPISFIFGAQMPQLELGLGVKGLNIAGNVTLVGQTGIATSGPGCDTRQMRVLGTAGVSANFFGFSAGPGPATLFDKTINASYPAGCGTFP